MVIAIPAGLLVQHDQQQLLVIQRLQQSGAVRDPRHGLAKRSVQAVEDRGLQQKPNDLVGLRCERVLDALEILREAPEKERMVAAELGEFRSEIRASCKAAGQPSVASCSREMSVTPSFGDSSELRNCPVSSSVKRRLATSTRPCRPPAGTLKAEDAARSVT